MADREKIIVDDALALLNVKEDSTVHVFSNPGMNMLIGADWDLPEVEKAIRDFGGAWITGELAQGMHHGLAVEQDGKFYFLETKHAD